MHRLLTLLILSLTVSTTQACFITSQWDMFVTNSITDNIVAHVKSRDDDLGNHTIPFNGNYNWSFCDMFDGHTLFYGYFWWGSKFLSLALFDDNIRGLCTLPKGGSQHCYWLVRPEGFYVSASNRVSSELNWVFVKNWDG
ncbi:hypothetical protein R6Q59_010789 [Mikania micrantha]